MNEITTRMTIDPSVIDEINATHDRIASAIRMTLSDAIAAGRLLAEVKGELPHGEWSKWVEQNCRFSLRTAQLYMRCHRRSEELEIKSASLAHLGIEEAQSLLAEPTDDGLRIVEWPEAIPSQGQARVGFAHDVHGTVFIEIVESTKHPGYYHVAMMGCLGDLCVTGTKRPVISSAVRAHAQFCGFPVSAAVEWQSTSPDEGFGLCRLLDDVREDAWR